MDSLGEQKLVSGGIKRIVGVRALARRCIYSGDGCDPSPPMGATLSPMVEKARVKLSSLGMGCGPGGHQEPPSVHFRVLETVVGQVGSLDLLDLG